MKKIFQLTNCSTCKRILSELDITPDVIIQDIKEDKITEKQLQEIVDLAGSYEKVFSKVAMKYRILGLDKQVLTENDYKKFILEEYTFLKRPVIIVDKQIFIGSAKYNIAEAKIAFNK
jgi:arsenate reductase